jgi:hypothetical protein
LFIKEMRISSLMMIKGIFFMHVGKHKL